MEEQLHLMSNVSSCLRLRFKEGRGSLRVLFYTFYTLERGAGNRSLKQLLDVNVLIKASLAKAETG